MKSIIDGKLYDTETATEIERWQNMTDCTNPRWYQETLHLTPNGAWFLEGHGGADSHYAEWTGDGLTSSSAIVEMSSHEAFEWLARKGFPETALQHFRDKIKPA